MTKKEYQEFHKKFCEDMVRITQAKNSDYCGSSENPFANFLGISQLVDAPNVVEIGFLTRMSDKMSRLGSFVTKGTLAVKDESVRDSLIDLSNYCALFAGYLASKQQIVSKKPSVADVIGQDKLAEILKRAENFTVEVQQDGGLTFGSEQRINARESEARALETIAMTQELNKKLKDMGLQPDFRTGETVENTYPTIAP